VLLAEDEVIIAIHLEEALGGAGWEVVGPVADVGSALGLAARERLDAALLNVGLRGERSFPVAEALAARGVPFVFLSGAAARNLPPGPLAAAPRLDKPYLLEDVLAALAAAARRAA
jgi:DNA-binding response OmpR family regulator